MWSWHPLARLASNNSFPAKSKLTEWPKKAAMDKVIAANEIMEDRDREESQRVVFIYSEEYLNVCEQLPKTKGRASLVQELLESYKLLEKMRVVAPMFATKEALASFHCKKYIHCLEDIQKCLRKNESDNFEDSGLDDLSSMVSHLDDHGIGYDCAPFENILDFVSMVAGGTIKCAELLNSGNTRLAINLNGGWHHAHRDEAAGFCYVNDIVLGILKLKEKFKRILYIDLDIHHGDGVEEAFASTDKVMTVSFHKFQDGYFPGTGNLSDVGRGRGKYYTINVPLKEGINDEQYCNVFTRIIGSAKDAFQPDVVVCQCGADGLNGDPLGGFNLTGKSISMCVDYVNKWKLPMLVLGGGGYHFTNTSRIWTAMIATLLHMKLDDNIPEHKYFHEYAPFFDINVTQSVRKSSNTQEYLNHVVSIIAEYLDKIKLKTQYAMSNIGNRNRKEKSRKRLLNSSPAKENKAVTLVPCGANKRVFEHRELFSNNDVIANKDIQNNNNVVCQIVQAAKIKDFDKQKNALRPRKFQRNQVHERTTCNTFDFDDDIQ